MRGAADDDVFLSSAHSHRLSMVLTDISNRVPEDFPYAPLIKNITMGLATESQGKPSYFTLHLLFIYKSINS